jgi:hypothetical protein
MTGGPETDLPVLNVGLVGDLACTPKVDKNFRGALCHITRRAYHTQGISHVGHLTRRASQVVPEESLDFSGTVPANKGKLPYTPLVPGKRANISGTDHQGVTRYLQNHQIKIYFIALKLILTSWFYPHIIHYTTFFFFYNPL